MVTAARESAQNDSAYKLSEANADHCARLPHLCEAHAPHRVSCVDHDLQEYRGREEALMQVVVNRLVQEPLASPPSPSLPSPSAAADPAPSPSPVSQPLASSQLRSPSTSTTAEEFRARAVQVHCRSDPSEINSADHEPQEFHGRKEGRPQCVERKSTIGSSTAPVSAASDPTGPLMTSSPQLSCVEGRSGGSLVGSPDASAYEAYLLRLQRMYEHYAPQLVPRASDHLQRYPGREEEVIKAAVVKFGPEPAATVAEKASLPPAAAGPSERAVYASEAPVRNSTPEAPKRSSVVVGKEAKTALTEVVNPTTPLSNATGDELGTALLHTGQSPTSKSSPVMQSLAAGGETGFRAAACESVLEASPSDRTVAAENSETVNMSSTPHVRGHTAREERPTAAMLSLRIQGVVPGQGMAVTHHAKEKESADATLAVTRNVSHRTSPVMPITMTTKALRTPRAPEALMLSYAIAPESTPVRVALTQAIEKMALFEPTFYDFCRLLGTVTGRSSQRMSARAATALLGILFPELPHATALSPFSDVSDAGVGTVAPEEVRERIVNIGVRAILSHGSTSFPNIQRYAYSLMQRMRRICARCCGEVLRLHRQPLSLSAGFWAHFCLQPRLLPQWKRCWAAITQDGAALTVYNPGSLRVRLHIPLSRVRRCCRECNATGAPHAFARYGISFSLKVDTSSPPLLLLMCPEPYEVTAQILKRFRADNNAAVGAQLRPTATRHVTQPVSALCVLTSLPEGSIEEEPQLQLRVWVLARSGLTYARQDWTVTGISIRAVAECNRELYEYALSGLESLVADAELPVKPPRRCAEGFLLKFRGSPPVMAFTMQQGERRQLLDHIERRYAFLKVVGSMSREMVR